MPDDLSPLAKIAGYLDTRAKQRQAARDALLTQFTDRERALIQEAAVMGYVLGVKNGPHRETIPPDPQILVEVVDACMVHSDLYPTIANGATP